MNVEDFDDDLEELSSAEDFLNYFNVDYDQSIVHVNRLHILQRFNEYLSKIAGDMPVSTSGKHEVYTRLLTQAYMDFVNSDALTEKVFKVFHMHKPQEVFISLDQLKK